MHSHFTVQLNQDITLESQARFVRDLSEILAEDARPVKKDLPRGSGLTGGLDGLSYQVGYESTGVLGLHFGNVASTIKGNVIFRNHDAETVRKGHELYNKIIDYAHNFK